MYINNMVYPAVAAAVAVIVAIIYAVKRILNPRQSSSSETDSSADASPTGKKQPTEQEDSVSEQGGSPSSTESDVGSTNNSSTDRKKTDSGTVPTDVTYQGRIHSLILEDIRNDGVGIGRFHGLVIHVKPFTDSDDKYQIGDKVKVKVTDVANKYATAVPLEKL